MNINRETGDFKEFDGGNVQVRVVIGKLNKKRLDITGEVSNLKVLKAIETWAKQKPKPKPKGKALAVIQSWIESERGWGQRPDGFTMHLNEKDCKDFITSYNKEFNNLDSAPDCYTRADGSPYIAFIDMADYQSLVRSKSKGKWGSGNNGPKEASADEIMQWQNNKRVKRVKK